MVKHIYDALPQTGFLRLPTVLYFVPVGRSSWWKGIKDKRYPAGIKLGPKTTVWRAEDIRDLLASFDKKTSV